jgi:Methyltransferase domain
VSSGVIETATDRNRAVAYESYDSKVLPFQNDTLDIVFTIWVLHHVPPKEWSDFVWELR